MPRQKLYLSAPVERMDVDGADASDGVPDAPATRAALVNGRLRASEESSTHYEESSGATTSSADAPDANTSATSNGFIEPAPPVNGVGRSEAGAPGAGGGVGEGGMLGAYRPSISQEVFEKIRERIVASKEREKQSLAKQILRKEEEKKKLARDRDAAADLESKMAKLRDSIKQEKAKQMKLFTQMKQAKNNEESLKKQQKDAKDRGREMTSSMSMPPQHHSYANASMLISQTNPAMRPRLLNYPPMNVPMGAMVHQNNTHLEPHQPHGQKRQRSVSPGVERIAQQQQQQQSHAHAQAVLSGSSRQQQPPPSAHDVMRSRAPSTGGPPPQSVSSKIPRPSMMPPNESPHSGRSAKSPPKPTSTVSSMNQSGGSVSTPMQVAGLAGSYGNNAAAYSTLGSQVYCLVPNMLGAAAGGVAPQLMLQKPENIAALSPQQQSIMAQQIHAMNASNPEYMRALQQALETQQQQQSVRAAGEAAALYRHYGIQPGAVIQQPMLMRAGLPSNAGGAQLNSPATSAQMPDGSQRVGSIMTGVPVFGPGMAGSPYGGGAATASSAPGSAGNIHSRVPS
ncbi:uncharacterized protein LOC129582216 [Paramacrobiotus metropolitanus]|uniref:uncharacterized protein LOC129582216 n=1 Tax=Paramacrobiotus metropolitanus TaxID=2943436 RepID=UPI002445EE7A|nr:uncharacterized protein LOC129582216 [Paramacrobiotus metropolitanus]